MSFLHRTAMIHVMPQYLTKNPAELAYELGTVALIVLLLSSL